MPYFFAQENLKIGEEAVLESGETAHLLLSRRLKAGEKIKLQGPDGGRFLCEVAQAGKKTLRVLPLEKLVLPPEPELKIWLFQSYVSQAAMDLILQKATELQANRICVFNSRFTSVRLGAKVFRQKETRWQKVVREAAKQSERAVAPEIEFLPEPESVIQKINQLEAALLLDPQSQAKISSLALQGCSSLGLVIGPEGGLSKEENSLFLKQKKIQGISLGPLLLRAETAAIAALAVIRNL